MERGAKSKRRVAKLFMLILSVCQIFGVCKDVRSLAIAKMSDLWRLLSFLLYIFFVHDKDFE